MCPRSYSSTWKRHAVPPSFSPSEEGRVGQGSRGSKLNLWRAMNMSLYDKIISKRARSGMSLMTSLEEYNSWEDGMNKGWGRGVRGLGRGCWGRHVTNYKEIRVVGTQWARPDCEISLKWTVSLTVIKIRSLEAANRVKPWLQLQDITLRAAIRLWLNSAYVVFERRCLVPCNCSEIYFFSHTIYFPFPNIH